MGLRFGDDGGDGVDELPLEASEDAECLPFRRGNDFGSDFCGLVRALGVVPRGDPAAAVVPRRREPVALLAGFNGDDFAVGRAAAPLGM